MSIQNLSDADLRGLVKWSPKFCDQAQRELDARAARRQPSEVRRDRAQVRELAVASAAFPSGRWV